MALEYVLFDLDGTLTDPALGITNCVIYALEKFGIHPSAREELHPYIGPPLVYSFTQFHGLSEEDAIRAVAYYRERFSVDGWRENSVFDGIHELLCSLQEKGVKLILATSKPEVFALRILEHFDLAKYFIFAAGSTLDGQRPEKADVIAYIQEKYPHIRCENTLMVGDRCYDVLGAHCQGLQAVGVLFGYGDRKEMEQAGADYIVENVSELQQLLLSKI